jgi:hypothetical protein
MAESMEQKDGAAVGAAERPEPNREPGYVGSARQAKTTGRAVDYPRGESLENRSIETMQNFH